MIAYTKCCLILGQVIKNIIKMRRHFTTKILHVNDPSSSPKLHVVVFGASSQISPYLSNLLGYLGAQVCFPTRTSAKWVDGLKPSTGYKNIAIRQFIDFKDETIIDKLIDGSNVVINLIGGNKYMKNYDLIYEGNVTLPKRIAEACARNSDVLRLIHFSSVAVDPNSISTRLQTKWIGEQEVKAAYPTATIIRPTTMFSELDNYVTRLGLLQRWLGFIPVIGHATELRQPIHAYDVSLAVINALKMPETAGKTYELGGPHVYTHKEICEIIYNKIGIPPNLKSFKYQSAHRLFTWIPHAHGIGRHMTLNDIQESNIDLIVGKDALGIDKLFVKPLSFPQNIMRMLSDYQAKVDVTLDEAEQGWTGGTYDRHFDP
jgi:NADH dehydrogenase (ubiquinone) 1 alpha subcomplex subunit 9